MKKFFFFASAALVLASCSSEAEEAVIKPNETPEEEVLELTEIKLGAGAPTVSAETRAAVPLDSWNNTPVGIFGVNEYAYAEEKDWNVTTDRSPMGITVEKAVILWNEPATVASSPNVVTFTNALPNKFYFPRTNNNRYGYTFLGYYPYIETTPDNPTASTDKITVTGTFDGTQDIMAGKAESAPGINSDSPDVHNSIGYNAKYIRDYKTVNGSEDYPEIDIKFEHLTSKIDVIFKKGSSYHPNMCNVHAAWFEVAKDYTLTFAQATNDVTTSLAFEGNNVNAYAFGGDTFEENKAYKKDDIVRHTEGETTGYYKFRNAYTGRWDINQVDPAEPATPDEKNTDTNDCRKYTIFVTPAPVDNGTTTKTLYLVLNDNPSSSGNPVIVTSPDGGFEAGKAYKVIVTINGPEEINVTASITEWTDGDDVTAEI